MTSIDEPVLGGPSSEDAADQTPLAGRIKRLVEGEPFAVLCTQGEGQPYGSVIAFVVSDDLTQAAFCTGRATRKYRLLTSCQRVALVIDNRGKHPGEVRRVEAVTITGRSTELPAGAEHDHWHDRLHARHPYLKEFLESPSCAIFHVELVRYLHVVRFQEVRQWIPGSPA